MMDIRVAAAGLLLLLLVATTLTPAGAGPIVVTGPEAGGGPEVRVFDALTGTLLFSFFAFDPAFLGGVRVGTVDANGDGVPEVIVAAGPGGGPHLRVFDGASIAAGQLVELSGIFAYDPGLLSGIFVAGGDEAAVRLQAGTDQGFGGNPNVLGGSRANFTTGGLEGATVAGGGSASLVCGGPGLCANRVTDGFGTVGGGLGNQAGDAAGGASDRMFATVSGGVTNTASGAFSVVGGGNANQATGLAATVAGGNVNLATGEKATVGGGQGNAAGGLLSFAAGHLAKALHEGTFVWADASPFDFASTAANEWSVRATGGARVVLAIDGDGAPTWTCSAANGGGWACSSDRALKENLVVVDGADTLRRLRGVPIFRWSARGADPAVTHVGPTAQDFHAAFGLGDSDRHISTIDLDGVALAAIQALDARNQALEAEVRRLTARLADVEQLRARLDALERTTGARQAATAVREMSPAP